MTFDQVLKRLDKYTAAPKDGDYDRHTMEAMKAVYLLMQRDFSRYLTQRVIASQADSECDLSLPE